MLIMDAFTWMPTDDWSRYKREPKFYTVEEIMAEKAPYEFVVFRSDSKRVAEMAVAKIFYAYRRLPNFNKTLAGTIEDIDSCLWLIEGVAESFAYKAHQVEEQGWHKEADAEAGFFDEAMDAVATAYRVNPKSVASVMDEIRTVSDMVASVFPKAFAYKALPIATRGKLVAAHLSARIALGELAPCT